MFAKRKLSGPHEPRPPAGDDALSCAAVCTGVQEAVHVADALRRLRSARVTIRPPALRCGSAAAEWLVEVRLRPAPQDAAAGARRKREVENLVGDREGTRFLGWRVLPSAPRLPAATSRHGLVAAGQRERVLASLHFRPEREAA